MKSECDAIVLTVKQTGLKIAPKLFETDVSLVQKLLDYKRQHQHKNTRCCTNCAFATLFIEQPKKTSL